MKEKTKFKTAKEILQDDQDSFVQKQEMGELFIA